MIQIVDEGVLYRNPKPDLRAVHACYPSVQPLSASEFLCTYQRGSAFCSVDGRVAQLRSTDGGRNWAEEGCVWDGSRDDRPYSYRGAGLTRLADGTILLLCQRYDRSDPELQLFNPVTDGMLHPQMLVFRTADGGRIWSDPDPVALPDGLIGCSLANIFALDDGTLMLPFETWKGYDDPGPLVHAAMALFSRDGGRSWGEPVPMFDGIAEGVFYWDARLAQLGGGRLVSASWTHARDTDRDRAIHLHRSDDNGRSWSSAASTGLNGQVCWPVALGDGRLLLLYNRRYRERPGIIAVLSRDEGASWEVDEQITVWDAAGQGNVGVARNEGEMADMTTFAFGRPEAVRLPDGDILAGFWCTGACITHIRWCRLRVE